MFNIWKLGDSELFTFDDTFGFFFSLFEIFKYQTELMKQKMTRILEKKERNALHRDKANKKWSANTIEMKTHFTTYVIKHTCI